MTNIIFQEINETDIDWSGDFSTYQMAMPTLASDWDSASDDIWNDL